MSRTRLALVALVLLGLVLAVPALASAPRSGTLHITKNCDEYTGESGSFCTITSSNLWAIPAGSRVVYASPPGDNGVLDSEIVVYTRGANAAFGHVVLDLGTGPGTGTVTLSGGTGQFKSFSATVDVSYLGGADFGWDGGYSY
ncbi:MAG: hypothetical protein ACXVRJ_00300 [Gaiellaceae bacterium]